MKTQHLKFTSFQKLRFGKLLLLCLTLLVLFVTQSFAQSPIDLSISPTVDTTDKATAEMYHFFKYYLNSRPDSIYHNDFWSGSSKEQYPIPDLAAKFIYPYVTKPNSYYHAKILSIKFDTSECRIQTLYSKNGTQPYDTLAIQSLYLDYSHNKWHFRSLLPINTKSFLKHNIGRIRYKIAPNYAFDVAEAQKAAIFVDSIVKVYDLGITDSIDYYLVPTRSEMYQIIGFDYYPYERDGIAIEENSQIITTKNYHPHEIVHVLFKQYVSAAQKFLREGLATLIAGSPQFDNSFKIVCRKNWEIISADTSITFQRIMANRNEPSYDLFFYTTGAIICDQILKYYGIAGLKKVMVNTKTDQQLANLLEQGLHFTKDNLESKWRQLWEEYGKE